MTIKTARILCLILSSLLFFTILFFRKDNTSVPTATPENIVAEQTKPLKIKTKTIKKPKPATVQEFPKEAEPTEEQIDEQIEIPQSGLQYLDNFINLDTSDISNLTQPIIDLQKVYSKIVYPSSKRRQNIESSFNVRVFIDTLGNVSIRIPNDVDPAFAQAVQNAFKKIKAQPATLDNKPIDVTFTVPIRFSLY